MAIRAPKKVFLQLIAFVAASSIGGLIAALLIGFAYGVVVGPDPHRFGLLESIAMDAAVVGVVMAILRGLRWLGERKPKNHG